MREKDDYFFVYYGFRVLKNLYEGCWEFDVFRELVFEVCFVILAFEEDMFDGSDLFTLTEVGSGSFNFKIMGWKVPVSDSDFCYFVNG